MVVSQLIKILEKLLHDVNCEEDIINVINDWENSRKPTTLKRKHTRFKSSFDFNLNTHENKILLYEGNVWSALVRILNGNVVVGFDQRPRKTLIRGSTSNTTVNDYSYKIKQNENFQTHLKPFKPSNFHHKPLERKETYKSKKNSLLRHCFTGRFENEESPHIFINDQINSPLSQKDNSSMLKHIKEIVFSDLFKENESILITEDIGIEQQSNQIQVIAIIYSYSAPLSLYDIQS